MYKINIIISLLKFAFPNPKSKTSDNEFFISLYFPKENEV